MFCQHHTIDVRDLNQPLLVSRPKKADIRRGMDGPILLLPELCTITGKVLFFLLLVFLSGYSLVTPLCGYLRLIFFVHDSSCWLPPLPFSDLSSPVLLASISWIFSVMSRLST